MNESRLPAPLGDPHCGECHAATEPFTPDDELLKEACNLGYARGRCPHFPGGDAPDAVRFCVSRDDGPAIGLLFVIERDHRPHAHGSLEFLRESEGLAVPPENPLLARQAEAYARAYLRRAAAPVQHA